MQPYFVHLDDDLEERDLFEEMLMELDPSIKYLGFESGETALAFLKKVTELPCIILVDLQLPGLDGRAIISALRKDVRYLDSPIICLSNLFSTTDIELCTSLNVYHFIKPSSLNKLKELVHLLLSLCIKRGVT